MSLIKDYSLEIIFFYVLYQSNSATKKKQTNKQTNKNKAVNFACLFSSEMVFALYQMFPLVIPNCFGIFLVNPKKKDMPEGLNCWPNVAALYHFPALLFTWMFA